MGDTYKPPKAEETIREAYDWYGERGYIHARISEVEDVEDGSQLRLKFLRRGGRPGPHRTDPHRRETSAPRRRSSAASSSSARATSTRPPRSSRASGRSRTWASSTAPCVEFADSADPNDIDLVFTVEERQTGRAGVGVSHTSEKGITGFLELTEGNLFGNGQYLDLKWEFGKKNTEVVLGFTEPWFMNRRLSVGFDLYDTNDKRVYSSLSDDFYEDAFPDDRRD